MTTRNPDWQGPRNLTGGDGYLVDLGLVSLRDAAIYGRTRPLIPYADGRLISSVRFVPGGRPLVMAGLSPVFFTPNTVGGSNYGFAELSEGIDTLGLITEGDQTDFHGGANDASQILDCGPLALILNGQSSPPWQPLTAYALGDSTINSAGHYQQVQVNGVSGATEPTWNNSSGTTSDGTITWTDVGLIDGQIHPIVEVVEGVGLMPLYPATIEFIDPPTDTVAGQTMSDVTVIVKDQNGDPYIFKAMSVYLAIMGDGTLSGTAFQNTDTTTGIATFNDLSIAEAAMGYIMRASSSIFPDPIFSDPFDVT